MPISFSHKLKLGIQAQVYSLNLCTQTIQKGCYDETLVFMLNTVPPLAFERISIDSVQKKKSVHPANTTYLQTSKVWKEALLFLFLSF